MLRALYRFVVKKCLRLNKPGHWRSQFYMSITPVTDISTPLGTCRFYCPNDNTHYRAKTLLDKEPQTIEWIDGFGPSAVFLDIGANVGCYTLYAALRGCSVYAFEPVATNFDILNRNIQLNSLQDHILAFPVALTDHCGADVLQLSGLWAGANMVSVDPDLPGDRPYRQGTVALTVDRFCREMKIHPNHIKIDVDGVEPAILEGARETLMSPAMRSLLVETDLEMPGHVEAVEMLKTLGYEIERKDKMTTDSRRIFNIIYRHERSSDNGTGDSGDSE